MTGKMRRTLVNVSFALLATTMLPLDAVAAKRKVVHRSPVRVVEEEYDWRTDTFTQKTEGSTTYDTAQDPDRFDAVPGTKQKVERVVRDKDGQIVRETGVIWESPSGTRHGNIKRQKTNPSGGEHTENIHFFKQ